jgi:IclR family acetate operon transcriptional repressor
LAGSPPQSRGIDDAGVLYLATAFVNRLQAELAETRQRGYALDREERRQGVICLAAPIRERTGAVVAAVSVTGSLERMTEDYRGQILPRVLEAANRISFRLGYHGSSAYL